MTEEDPDLLADDGDHDQSRSRSPFPAMSERFRLTEELENARYQNKLLTQKCRELEMQIKNSKNGFEGCCPACEPVGEMNKKLRDERDEARREVCGFHHLTGFLSGDYAISRGWDCYENYSGEGFPQSVKDFKEFLKATSEENLKSFERLWEENRKLREERAKGVING